MNQNQAKEYYKKLFVNYPDVLSVEEATTLLGFKSQTAIIRRIHQHRIRCLKVPEGMQRHELRRDRTQAILGQGA